MKLPGRSIISLVSIVLVVVAFVFFYWLYDAEEKNIDTVNENRLISYSIEVKNKTSSILSDVEIFIRGPNKKTSNQICLDINANHPFDIETDESSNQLLKFNFSRIPPFATKIIQIDAHLFMRPVSEKENIAQNNGYLGEEQYIETGNSQLQDLGRTLKTKDTAKTIENIYKWVSTNISKAQYSNQPKGALYTILKKKGDCTEFMHLFIALCRINQIPARAVNGYVVTSDRHIEANDLHDWAQVYVEEMWRTVDPFYKKFLKDEESYVTMFVQGGDDFDAFLRWHTESPDISIEMIR